MFTVGALQSKGIEMGQRLVTNSMLWGWKISFWLVATFFYVIFVGALSGLGSELFFWSAVSDIVVGSVPIVVWSLARWLALE